MQPTLWNRLKNAALIATSLGCVALLVLLLWRGDPQPPEPANQSKKTVTKKPVQKPGTQPKQKVVVTKPASLKDDLDAYGVAAEKHPNLAKVIQTSGGLRKKYQRNPLALARIRFREAGIYRALLHDEKREIEALEQAKQHLDAAQAEHGLLKMKVLVDIGEAYSGHGSTEQIRKLNNKKAIKNYSTALDIPIVSDPYSRYLKEFNPLYFQAAHGAVWLMPKDQLVKLDLYPGAVFRLWDMDPRLKPHLSTMSRTFANARYQVRVWLQEMLRKHRNDRKMKEHLKSVLALHLRDK